MAAIVVTVTVTGKLVHHHPFLSVNPIIRGGETRCEFCPLHCAVYLYCSCSCHSRLWGLPGSVENIIVFVSSSHGS